MVKKLLRLTDTATIKQDRLINLLENEFEAIRFGILP
jgi:hypothetical protein